MKIHLYDITFGKFMCGLDHRRKDFDYIVTVDKYGIKRSKANICKKCLKNNK